MDPLDILYMFLWLVISTDTNIYVNGMGTVGEQSDLMS